MRHTASPVLAWLLLAALPPAHALDVTVTSTPPGAEVFASPKDDPVIYKKGVTPCTVALSAARGPHRLVIRKAGYFDSHRKAVGGALEVSLASRDEPGNWERLPRVDDTTPHWPSSVGEGWGLWGTAARKQVDWAVFAPDGSGVLLRGTRFGNELLPLGLTKPGEEREGAELWWVAVTGATTLVWRYVSEPNTTTTYSIDAAVSPDAGWVVHSAPVGGRERLDLLRLSDRKRLTIASDKQATLYCPAFSADGRRVACLRTPRGVDEDDPSASPGAEVQVMAWDGGGRRTLARDAYGHLPPSFSPDGTRLAYVNAEGGLSIVELQTGVVSRVPVQAPWWPAETPLWSPDGGSLACSACQFSGLSPVGIRADRPRRVVWVAADGSASGHVTGVTLHGWHDASSLDVYAVGYHIPARASYRRLLRVDLSGSLKTVLRQAEAVLYAPALSPNGKIVAALNWRPDKGTQLALVDTTSRAVRQLDLPQAAEPEAVGWLDDEIPWVRVASGPPGVAGYRLNVETGAAEPLTEVPVTPQSAELPAVYCADGDVYLGRFGEQDDARPLTFFAWYGGLAPAVPGGDGR